uniref:Putative ovule protein n=1 Tax=Solanum chacoense TaxID=4108 RepID=A0A0V0I5T3_SOLCH
MKEWKVPWQLTKQIEEIRQILTYTHSRIQHAFRETNQLADKLANIVLDQETPLYFNKFLQLPVGCKKLLNIAKTQVSTLRIRTRKINNIH